MLIREAVSCTTEISGSAEDFARLIFVSFESHPNGHTAQQFVLVFDGT